MSKYQEVKITKSEKDELELSYDKDITYSKKGQEQQKLQIIYPNKLNSDSERCYPGVVYQLMTDVEADTIYDKVPRLAKFAQRGYVVILVKNLIEADYKEVIDYLYENADNYSLAKEQLFVLREMNKKERMSLEEMKEVVIRQEATLSCVKAIISIGNKENFKELSEDTKLSMPPVLSLVTEQQYGWFTEDNFDKMEDFISNYI